MWYVDKEVDWNMLREWNMEVEKRMQSSGQHTIRAKQRMTQETHKQERAHRKMKVKLADVDVEWSCW